MTRFFAVVSVVLLGLSSGCTPTLCDKSQQTDLTKKAGDCAGVTTSLLGGASSCASKVSSCSAEDQKLLGKTLDCLGGLSACTSGTREVYVSAQKSCLDPLVALTTPCLDAVLGGVKPGEDAGVDGGVVDAGPQAVNDGGAGLVLVAVADETTIAFAWSKAQPGDIARFALIGAIDGGREAERGISSGRIDTTLPTSATQSSSFILAGYNAQGELSWGSPDAGLEVDAGTAQCSRPAHCPDNQVCDLGRCKAQNCTFGGMNTCPTQYQCVMPGRCTRTDFDGGSFDAGSISTVVVDRALPFVSNEVSVVAGTPIFKADVPLGGFVARRPDVLAIDTARVIIAAEQEGQLFVHTSAKHGADLGDDARTTSAVDTVGTRVRTAYNPDSRLIFACYTVGRGVRVQISTDFGRSWGRLATTIETIDDGGTSLITDCDLATWKEGGALLVTVEDGAVQTRVISSGLSVGEPVTAFSTSTTYFAPSHPSVATLSADSIVHITFTASRLTSGGAQDTEPLGVYRDGTLGAFTQPQGLTVPTANLQDFTSVIVDPKTKRGLAAFTSVDATTGGTPISTVYVSMWNPTLRQWVSGSDLQVFATQQNTTLLFPSKAPTDLWYAFSPSVVALASGKLGVALVAGPRLTSGGGDYRQYFIPFDFEQSSPLATGKGWFVRPVVKVSETRVLDPKGASSVPQPSVSSAAGDSQISIYGAFIEGVGPSGDIEGRALVFSRP